MVIEQLESRLLLSASIVARPVADTLLVRGTANADTITVGVDAANANLIDVSINGVVQQFDKSSIQAITIRAGGGNDVVSIDETHGQLPVGVQMFGEGGGDRLNGSSLADSLRGGAGVDYLFGKAGDDSLGGDDGKDYLWGEAGNDQIRGGASGDALYGGDGDDALYGDGGNDVIEGGTGQNTTKGGVGWNNIDNDFAQGAKSMASHATGAPSVDPYGTINSPWGYDVQEVRDAYQFGDLNDSNFVNRGAGQAIAIVDAYDTPTALSDLISFSNQYNLTAPTTTTFQTVYAAGVQPPMDPSVVTDGTGAIVEQYGWEMESNLDVQWAHAIAPSATIYLVEAASNLHTDMAYAVQVASKLLMNNHGGGVVSMSFGSGSEAASGLYEAVFNNAKYKPITYVAASGDDGGYISYPSTSPRVLAVGGTTLTFTGGTKNADTAWADSGGGMSYSFEYPAYQSGVSVGYYGGTIDQYGYRMAPDVAYNAGSGVSTYNRFASYDADSDGNLDQGWMSLLGTSAGTPQWAGLIALANEQRSWLGQAKIGNKAHNILYKLANLSQSTYYEDITANDFLSGSYPASSGWDLATGWGTPHATTLISALATTSSVATGTRSLDFTAEYKEATANYPGGAPQLWLDYNGVGSAVIGVSSVTLTLTVTSKFNNTTYGTFTTTLVRHPGGRISGTIPYFTVDGPITTSSFNLVIEGRVWENEDGGASIKGSFFGLSIITGKMPEDGLEPSFEGNFSSDW